MTSTPTEPRGAVAVLCNPRSGRVRKDIDEVRRIGQVLGGDLYAEAVEPAQIAEALLPFLSADVGALCVIAGDGTVHAVLTALYALRPEGPWPVLAVVPGGSTNMTVQDLGGGGRLRERLRAAEAWAVKESGGTGAAEGPPGADPVPRSSVSRPFLLVEHGERAPICGMFFGAGAVADGVGFFNRRLRTLGLGDRLFSRLSIARVLLSLALRGTRTKTLGARVVASVDGQAAREHLCIFTLASTLQRLVIGTRPFWGNDRGPLGFTLVEKGARAFWRSLPRIARGSRGDRLTPERGYFSWNATSVELTFDGPFVVDGEAYEARAAEGPVRLSAPREVGWLVP